MNKVIIYTDSDGSMCVVHPAPGNTLAAVIASAVPPGIAHQVIDADQLPQDRYFRDAWKPTETGIEIDIEAAKEIQRNHWRKLRAPKLAALDLEFMRSLEAGDAAQTAAIAAAKQALRDVTETILPDDLETIRNTIPEILQ